MAFSLEDRVKSSYEASKSFHGNGGLTIIWKCLQNKSSDLRSVHFQWLFMHALSSIDKRLEMQQKFFPSKDII
uniref:Uncharacterized protein n=1 Tax=Anguilla anguilla TaxID=7936 RepID=A0A0E9WKU1_ANGAN